MSDMQIPEWPDWVLTEEGYPTTLIDGKQAWVRLKFADTESASFSQLVCDAFTDLREETS